MPSASTKPESKASSEAGDPMKQVMIVMDKKVRNLEKRKGKLDTYMEKEKSGITLEKDQMNAVAKYGEVLQNLEFARELQKQFQSITNEAEKFLKRQAKKDKLERQSFELKRIQEILKLQNLLDSLGSDTVRSDFQTGKHGAVVLTEDNLNQLDELYKLISPSRDGETNYNDQLNTAADHIVSLIESKEKAIVGTTYKELKEMIDMIGDCGYFENAPGEEEGAEEGVETEFVVVSQTDAPQPDSAEVQASLPPEVAEQQQQLEQTSSALHTTQQPDLNCMVETDSFFSESAQPPAQQIDSEPASDVNQAYTRQRPFQEIVSEVQGNFNFLQESTIDMESPHMDPAVVAAHPMPPAPLGGPPTTLSSQTFTSSAFGDLPPSQGIDNSQTSQTSEQSLLSQQQSVSLTGQDYSSQEYNPQTFGQGSLTQGLQSDSLFHQSAGMDSTSGQLGQTVMGQGLSDTTISQFEIPPQIPMPPSREQSAQSDESQAEKKFQMNPNAQMFQSQIYNSSVGGAQQQDDSDFSQSQSQQQSDFSSYGNNYNSGFRNRGGGGFRGRGGRGGDRGGVSNGYGGRGGNRGGSDYRGGRGGSSYPPRQNYHRSEGYQGFNGNNSVSGGFQRREGGFSRGGNRGGPGSARGGPPRGGSRGNRGGGFGSRNQQQQQVA